MKKKIIIALLATLGVLAVLVTPQSADAKPRHPNYIVGWGTGHADAPVVGGSILTGRGSVQLGGQWASARIQVVLQYNTGANIPGTATGWISYTPGSTYQGLMIEKSVPKACLGSGSRTYRTEVQFSLTDIYGTYSGIGYDQSSFVSRPCVVSGS